MWSGVNGKYQELLCSDILKVQSTGGRRKVGGRCTFLLAFQNFMITPVTLYHVWSIQNLSVKDNQKQENIYGFNSNLDVFLSYYD